MKSLNILNTKDTPKIDFNLDGNFKIKGLSIPENPTKFYQDISSWVKINVPLFTHDINLSIYIEYMNTGSKKFVIELLKTLIKCINSTIKLTIIWHYDIEDDDIKEEGEIIQEILNFPFIFKIVEN